ncbi:MAG: DUF1292 domain-containing protein [Ruminococcaceae bacterium]|nr:DUF1292 domain-containing protein [Oscillospiraceae bacterium]
MSDLLNQLRDDELDFTVKITDTDGITAEYEFLDIVNYEDTEYAVLDPMDGEGYVDIFRIVYMNGKEHYRRETDGDILERVFDIFRIKNEDEFDFE